MTKTCPSCNQSFNDAALKFCPNDGTPLAEGATAAGSQGGGQPQSYNPYPGQGYQGAPPPGQQQGSQPYAPQQQWQQPGAPQQQPYPPQQPYGQQQQPYGQQQGYAPQQPYPPFGQPFGQAQRPVMWKVILGWFALVFGVLGIFAGLLLLLGGKFSPAIKIIGLSLFVAGTGWKLRAGR